MNYSKKSALFWAVMATLFVCFMCAFSARYGYITF